MVHKGSTSASLLRMTAAACSLALAGPLHAQSETELLAWLESELERAVAYPDIEGVSVSFGELFHPKMSSTDRTQLRQQVADRPDHPGRHELRAEERRAGVGPDVRSWTIWSVSQDRWRINQTLSYQSNLPYVDRVRRGRDGWMLTSEYLAVVDTANPPSGRDIGASEGLIRAYLDDFLFGGLGAGAPQAARLEDAAIQDGGWTVTRVHASASGARIAIWFRGRWDSNAGRGFVEQKRIDDSPALDAIGSSQTYSDWGRDERLGRWVCRRVDKHDSRGTLTESLVFQNSSTFTRDEFDRMTRIPDPAGADPIRGPVTIRTVNDFRETPAKWQTISSGRVEDSGRFTPGRRPSAVPWRRVGWGTAAVILTALVIIRIRRS